VIVPRSPPGKAVVFRAGFVDRDAAVDLGLLAKGSTSSSARSHTTADGPLQTDWDAMLPLPHRPGFSRTGDGRRRPGGWRGLRWAIANPDKVCCIYAENPVMHSNLAKTHRSTTLPRWPRRRAAPPRLRQFDPWLPVRRSSSRNAIRNWRTRQRVINEGVTIIPSLRKTSPAVDFIAKNAIQ